MGTSAVATTATDVSFTCSTSNLSRPPSRSCGSGQAGCKPPGSHIAQSPVCPLSFWIWPSLRLRPVGLATAPWVVDAGHRLPDLCPFFDSGGPPQHAVPNEENWNNDHEKQQWLRHAGSFPGNGRSEHLCTLSRKNRKSRFRPSGTPGATEAASAEGESGPRWRAFRDIGSARPDEPKQVPSTASCPGPRRGLTECVRWQRFTRPLSQSGTWRRCRRRPGTRGTSPQRPNRRPPAHP